MKMEPITYEEFAVAVEAEGLSARDCGNGHWQVIGGPNLVNFYPYPKCGATVYVGGTMRGKRRASVQDAIDAATAAPKQVATDMRGKRGKRKRYGRWKGKQLKQDPHCVWCGVKVSREKGETQATVDHRIPLMRGGLDHETNWVLACHKCNKKRGSDMPELSVKQRVEI